MPEDRQSFYDVEPDGEAVRAAVLTEAESAGTPDFLAVPVDYLQAEIADAAACAWVVARATPHPLATLAQPVQPGNPAAATLPRASVFCTEGNVEDSSSLPFSMKYRSVPGWRYRELAANHMAPVTAPQALAEAFLSPV